MIFFPLSLVQLSHFMSAQTEFWICCATFSPLENGKEKVLKKVSAWG
jgi:hypothetical protein